jgi:hypothetical protein
MRLSTLVLVVATVGCGDDSSTVRMDSKTMGDGAIDAHVNPSCAFSPPAAPTAGTAELGAADPPDLNNFTPVADGDTFQSYLGPQGGYHLWIDVRVQDMDPGDGMDVLTRPQTKFHIYTQDGTRVNLEDCAYRLQYNDGGDGYLYLKVAWLNQVLPEVGSTFNDTPLRLRVEVLDRNGHYAVDARSVIALKPIPTPIGP